MKHGGLLKPHAENGLVKAAIANIRRYFDAPNGLGPTLVADFLGEHDPEAREIRRRDAFETMEAVMRRPLKSQVFVFRELPSVRVDTGTRTPFSATWMGYKESK